MQKEEELQFMIKFESTMEMANKKDTKKFKDANFHFFIQEKLKIAPKQYILKNVKDVVNCAVLDGERFKFPAVHIKSKELQGGVLTTFLISVM